MNTIKAPRVDTLAFLDAHGRLPNVDENIGLEVAHVTAAPPPFLQTEQLLDGAETPGGHIPGINGFRGFLEKQGIVIVKSGDDLYNLELGRHPRAILGIQGSPVDADRGNLQRLHDAGLRVVGLGYETGDHPIGPGFMDNKQPLPDRGRRFIDDLASTGMVFDLSHAGHQAALDALDYIRDGNIDLPVFASHTGVKGKTSEHNRNFPVEVLDAIKERGGIIGIYGLTFALHDTDKTVQPMVANIHEAVDLLGHDAVAIGSDGIYKEFTEEERQQQFAMLLRMQKNADAFAPSYPMEADQLNTPTKMDVIADLLRQEGQYTESQIAAIIGGNALRFFRQSLR